MADVAIDKLIVSVEARTAQMERQLKKLTGQTARTAKTIEKQFGGLGKSFDDAGKSFKANFLGGISPAAIAASIGIGTITANITQAVNAAADMGEMATRLGITTDHMQALQKQALATGVGAEQLAKGLQSVAEQAATSGSYLQKLFEANGRSLRDQNGQLLPLIEIWKQLADMIRNTASAPDKLAIATAVMGDRIGRELVEAMDQGAAGVEAAHKRMIASGNYHTEAEIREMERLRDEYMIVIGELETVWQRFWIEGAKRAKTSTDEIIAIWKNVVAAVGYGEAVLQGKYRQYPPLPPTSPTHRTPLGVFTPDPSTGPRHGPGAIYRPPVNVTPPSKSWMQSPEFGGRNVVSVPATVLPQPPTPKPPKPPKPSGTKPDNSAEDAERARLERETNFFEEQKRRQEVAVNEFREANEKAAAAEKKANEDAARASAEAWEKFSSGMESIAQGVYTDLMNGASAAETLQNALRRLADTAFNELMGLLFQAPSGGGMSPFASFLQSAFGGGAAAASAAPSAPVASGLYGNAPGPIGAPAGNAGMSVRVYPPAGQPVATKQRSGGDGRALLDVYIGDQVRKVAPSVVGKMMPAQFGVTPALTRRT